MTDRKKFAPHGTLALAPQAFGLAFEVAEPAAPVVDDGGAAVVTVRGPLMHHRELFFDSYEAIADRDGYRAGRAGGGAFDRLAGGSGVGRV
jgi:hypothetical protein